MYRNKRDRTILWCEKMRCIVSQQIRLIMLVFFCFLFILSATGLALHYEQHAREDKVMSELAVLIPENLKTPPAANDNTSSMATTDSLQIHQTPTILAQYRELYKQNTDMVGWIKIDGTQINYPVMYTADNFYLSHGFDKEDSNSGVPFVDKRCNIDPFGTNTIIYGHNMRNGTMFAELLSYKEEAFFREHPLIHFDTLYAQQTYEIVAVFMSQIYHNSDMVFKHYDFLSADNAAAFDEYIANINALALYDTDVSASYGDELLTLVTCAYHTENGQFVVVAKRHS